MEEISETAKAYYANLSGKQKRLTTDTFQAIDANGDGKISFNEYAQYLKQKGFKILSSPDFFRKLDKDGNGALDFDEFITVHYICSSKRVYFCDECRVFLDGVYFTCVQCFNGPGNTYDLCCACYRDKDVNHKDALFLDNYTLLQARGSKIRIRFDGKSSPLACPLQSDCWISTLDDRDVKISRCACFFLQRSDRSYSFFLGNLIELRALNLRYNKLSGSIPQEIGKLRSLSVAFLSHNKLTGRLPASIGNLGKLTILHLHDNRLSGLIPMEIGMLTSLKELVLTNNSLTGSLSILEFLDLGFNKLSGFIPPEVLLLKYLNWIGLNDNGLTGSIPASVAN
ncbi:hypothetical protein GH714_021860 [Hevea brasiliensis]|uniref:EF-hand domain-containing protein n=1 Tax=Hevea brasiliensis TaxID=3981 RepID=A0A6A6MP88_HEVBR|nr:hypothetical protein GH714_021860 [Hevea brasiliensis]